MMWIVIAALGLTFNAWLAVQNMSAWGVDYNQFYAASRLAGTGHLYDFEALRKIERENGAEAPTGRLPVVIYGHKILGGLPYAVARAIWLAGGLVALMFFTAFWPDTRRLAMAVALAWSTPAVMGFTSGQDDPYWLMFFTAGLVLMEKKRPWISGAAFSLCICKFHLALGIPVMLVAQKRWKTLAAGAIATAIWIASCFLIEGSDWTRQYARISQIPAFSPAAERMPTLYGISSWLPWTAASEIVCALAIVWLLWVTCRNNQDLGITGAAAAACGLLLGHHAYAYDCVFVLPLAVLTIQRQSAHFWLQFWAALLLSPVPVVLLTSDRPLPGQLLVGAFVVTALIVAYVRSQQRVAQAAVQPTPIMRPLSTAGNET